MNNKEDKSLATLRPDLAKEWHPWKNGDLKPEDVTCGSKKKVWWYLPYDDPETGKHFDFEWKAPIYSRTSGIGCPYLASANCRVWLGFNDLATTHPELAKELHPTKNGDLKPTDVTAGSGKKVWWYLPYDDPRTGKHFDFEWEATISNRTNGRECPFLSGHQIWVGYNDLATTHPDIVKEWHPAKNGDLKPTDVTAGSGKKVWWYLPYDDPRTGKHFDFEWEAQIVNRCSGYGCPYLSNPCTAVWFGFNDLTTTHPELAKEWHPTKNGDLKPTDVTAGSGQKIWWYLPYDDPRTGKHFDFEWLGCICDRVCRDFGCPFLSGHQIWVGYNDLATTHPDIAKEWHPAKNGDLKPTDVMSFSNKKVWWYLPYDDPKTGKHFDFEWQTHIHYRTSKGHGCPYLSNQRVWPGYNDLATTHPDIASEWHPTKNGNLKPTDVSTFSTQKIWWYLPYDDPNTGKHFDFEWTSTVLERTRGANCPYLASANCRVWLGFNDLATTHPELAKEWHPTKNGDLKPTDVTAGSGQKIWWYLPYDDPRTGKHFDFEWECRIASRTTSGYGCPYLASANCRVWLGFNDLATTHPELAKEWHPTKNGDLKPTDITAGSGKKVWWYLPYDDPKTGKHFDFEWEAQIVNRCNGRGCPFLSESQLEKNIGVIIGRENIAYIKEKTFNNCISSLCGRLRYDFYLTNKCLFVEGDGVQHFKAINYFGGRKEFVHRIKCDNIKNIYAFTNNKPLLRIPYIYIDDKDKIEMFIKYFLETCRIPQEILDFYSQFKFSNYVECVTEYHKQLEKTVA